MQQSSIETAPAIRLPGEVKLAKSKRVWRKLSKLAMAVPAVVRSDSEQKQWDAIVRRALPVLTERRKKLTSSRQHNVTLAIQKLTVPMFGIIYNDDPTQALWFVSANVLSEYKREGIAVTVSMPLFYKTARFAQVRRSDIQMEYVERFARSRANDHLMGRIQKAWRAAHLEGDGNAEQAAYYWLYHGTMKTCHDIACKACAGMRSHKERKENSHLQSLELQRLVERYLA